MTDCKHDWHFVQGTDRLRCQRCGKLAGGFDWSQVALTTGQLAGYKLHDPRPNTIRFFHASRVSDGPDSVEVLRISKDGIWANPDIPADEAAKKVLEAIDHNIKHLLAHARKEELGACCDLLEGMHAASTGSHNYYLHAAIELRRLRSKP